MKQLGLQLFSVRDGVKEGDEASVRAAFKRISEIGYTEGQTAGFWGMDVPKFAEIAKENNVKIIGTHIGMEQIEKDPDGTMEMHKILGTTNIGIGGMPGYARESLAGLEKFIENVNKACQIFAKYGFKFGYHNHAFEFMRMENGKTMYQMLIDGFTEKNATFILDTYWVQRGGGDIADYVEKLAGRIEIMHLKDMRVLDLDMNTRFAEFGNGNLNFKKIIPLAEKTGVKNFVIEQDDTYIDNDPFKSVKVSFDNVKKDFFN